ncbi:MAG: hypothetical protein K5929_08075 [Lachnospiraceae bacterium]|nr:hypothetical protein [Lachnospiraceae bacterium]
MIILLILNLIAVCVYLILYRKREKRRGVIIKAVVMLLCPVAGVLFFGLAAFLQKTFFNEPVDLADVVFSKDRTHFASAPEESREKNLVSLEEAIEVTDNTNLRELMMSVVRGETMEFLGAISLALNSRDSETAHYAASVLQDAVNEFRLNVELRKKEYFETPNGTYKQVLGESIITYMNTILKQNVFSERETAEYVRLMERICSDMYGDYNSNMSAELMEILCIMLLNVHEYELCEKWCDRLVKDHPDSLPAYTCKMKLFFNTGRTEEFFSVVSALQNSTVVIDNETLEFLRAFR